MRQYDFTEIQRHTDDRIEKGILPGAVLCVNTEGKRVYEYLAGFSDVETRIPLCKDSIFRLASMTKPITATAVLIQQDRGLLSVKDEVRKYLPEFANRRLCRLDQDGNVADAGAAEREITIEDILTHSSGLCSGDAGFKQFSEKVRARSHCPSEIMPHYAEMLLDFSPGNSQFYSPLVALDLVARIVELTSGTEYESFLRKNVFEPLGMVDTCYRLTPEQKKRVVPMYRLSDAADSITRSAFTSGHEGFPDGCVAGVTCLHGTMEDYSKFAEMLCHDGKNGERILSENAVRSLRSPHFSDGFAGINRFFNWGYTVRVREGDKDGEQELTPGSYGWSGAYNTHFWVDPVRKVSAVYMSNLDNAGGCASVTAFEFECDVMRAIKKLDG